VLTFRPEWRAAVLAGAKVTTVRSKRLASVGDEFVVDGARFRVTAVEPITLRDARDKLWRDEGMASPEEFERVWRASHPTRGWRGGDQAWAHRFARQDK